MDPRSPMSLIRLASSCLGTDAVAVFLNPLDDGSIWRVRHLPICIGGPEVASSMPHPDNITPRTTGCDPLCQRSRQQFTLGRIAQLNQRFFKGPVEGDLSTCCGIQGQEGWCLRKVSDLGAALAMALSALCEKRFVDLCFEVFKRFLFVAVAPVEQISADTGVTLRFCRTGVCKAFRAILNPS